MIAHRCRWIATVRRLARDRRGVGALEFAIIAPVMLLLYLGGVQLMDAASAYRKVAISVRSLADLSTQNEQVTPAEVIAILNGARQVMTPYSTANSSMSIVAIDINATGNPSITWVCVKAEAASCGPSYAGLNVSTVPIPAALRVPNTTLLYSSLTLRYVPVAGGSIIGTIPMKDYLFMSPRRSPSVCLNTGTPSAPTCVGKSV